MTRGGSALAGLLAVATFTLVATLATDDRSGPGGSALGFGAVPDSYMIRYATADAATEMVVHVDRPWRSVTESGAHHQSSDFGLLVRSASGSDPAAFVSLPTIAPGDARPDVAMADAVAEGLARIGERRVIDGLECQLYRTGAPIDAGPIVPPSSMVVETCLDHRGLVLEERQLLGGEEILRRTAIDVVVPAPIDDATGSVEEELLDVDEGGAAVRPIDVDEARRLATWLLAAPTGFDLRGVFATVHADPQVQTDPLARFGRLASVTWVWERGPDVVIFETGAVIDGSPVPVPAGGTDIGQWPAEDASPGPATIWISARGNELRHTGRDGFVRLVATVTTDALMDIARTVRPAGGGA